MTKLQLMFVNLFNCMISGLQSIYFLVNTDKQEKEYQWNIPFH